MTTTYEYNQTGVHEPGAFALMRDWLADRGYPWTVRGIQVDKRAELVFNLPGGAPSDLLAAYGYLEQALEAPVVRPPAYLKQPNKALKMRGPWDGRHAARVGRLGWSNNREGLPPNLNFAAHALIWMPDGNKPRAQVVVSSDAPRMDVLHGPTGTFTSALLTWPALRQGLEDGEDVVSEVFAQLARAVEEQGTPFSMEDVFIHVGYGARKGFGLRKDGALWMKGIEQEDAEVPELYRNFGATISPISEYPPETTKYTVEKQPYGLDLARLAYLQARDAKVYGARVPTRQVIFSEICTLSERDQHGNLINASKRVRDADYGVGVHTGDEPAPEPLYGSAGGFAVYAA